MRFSSAFVAAALPFLVSAIPTPIPQVKAGLAIPLTKRLGAFHSNGTVNGNGLRAGIRSSVAKIQRGVANFQRNTGSVHPLASMFKLLQGRASDGTVPLTDSNDALWYGTISVGTPSNDFTVDFDTGSSDLFLPGPDCGKSCSGHATYNPSSSSTSSDVGKNFSLSYGDGSTVSGEQFKDTVTIAGLTAKSQTLGTAKTYSSGFNSDRFPADGLMGMGFKSISDYNADPVFQTLVADGAVSEPVFSFKLSNAGAHLYVGGSDSSQYSGDVTYVPVTQKGYWQVAMDGMSIGGSQAIGSTSAIIDTGTTLIVGDSNSIAKAYKSVDGAKDNGDGTYTVSCNQTSTISLTFGGTPFEISSASFTLDNGDGTCTGGLSYMDEIASKFWIVGDVFLQNVYTTFDVGHSQVGFAKLN